jgi:hypothetical protein
MFLTLNRILPDNVQVAVTINTDQVVWAQPDGGGATVTIYSTAGPELIVKNDNAAQKLLSGS